MRLWFVSQQHYLTDYSFWSMAIWRLFHSLQSGLHGFLICSHCDAQQHECSAEWVASKASISHLYRCAGTSHPSLWHYSTSSWYLALFLLMMITGFDHLFWGIWQQDLKDVGVMVLGNLSCPPRSTCSCYRTACGHPGLWLGQLNSPCEQNVFAR